MIRVYAESIPIKTSMEIAMEIIKSSLYCSCSKSHYMIWLVLEFIPRFKLSHSKNIAKMFCSLAIFYPQLLMMIKILFHLIIIIHNIEGVWSFNQLKRFSFQMELCLVWTKNLTLMFMLYLEF